MSRTVVPPYFPDSRANKLIRYQVMEVTNRVHPDNWIYLQGPDEVARQFKLLNGDACSDYFTWRLRAEGWTHGFHFPDGMPLQNYQLAETLERVLSLAQKPNLHCAIAFDWYKIPPTEESPQWLNTEAGELVNRAKYWNQGEPFVALVQKYVNVIMYHPLYAPCENIVTVPGHNADGQSFGERLAKQVALKSGKRLVLTQSPGGARPAAKEGAAPVIADGHFALPHRISGDAIILDDVCRSGNTMNSVGAAVRNAGASRAFGIAAVRTMRK